jgi:hypothetical protein
VKKWFLGKYKDAFKDYEDEQKAKAAAANATVDKDEWRPPLISSGKFGTVKICLLQK